MQKPTLGSGRQILASLAMLCMASLPVFSQNRNPVHLAEQHASRGDTFTVTIENGPATAKEKSAKLRRQGQEFDADDVDYTVAAGVSTVTGEVPKDLRLGDYEVMVSLDKRLFEPSSKLSVVPTGASGVHLSEIIPSSTYDTEVAYFQTGKSKKAVPTIVASLVLHGSGFQVQHPQDNTIWIDHIHTQVTWDSCSTDLALGTKNAPIEPGIHGEVVSAEQMKLCRLPVPPNGQILLAVGYGDVISETLPFRVFVMGKLRVALIAAVIALALALLPLGLLSFVRNSYRVAGQPYKLRMLFLDQETDTYSLSKLQFYLWTVAALFGYAYLFISRVKVQYLEWPDVPATLPGIISVAAGTAIGAQLITAVKGSKGAGEEKPSFADFITSGGVVAPDRLQMFLWTLFGVGAFFVAALDQAPGVIKELPAVPERLLYLMGISSAGYLGGKLARKPGPVINEISIDPPESDEAIAKAASTPSTAVPDLVEATVNAEAKLKSLPAVTNAHAKAAVDALGSAIRAARAAQTTSEITQMVSDLATLCQTAAQQAAATSSDFVATTPVATEAEAEAAQTAAVVLQDFSADVTQAVSAAASAAMYAMSAPTLTRRTIELRGTNLSAECVLEIDNADLPFRFLLNKDGRNAPEVVTREDATPTFARVLRLTIDPAKLSTAELIQFEKWFGSDGNHTFTLTNPDGQEAQVSFTLGAQAARKRTAS